MLQSGPSNLSFAARSIQGVGRAFAVRDKPHLPQTPPLPDRRAVDHMRRGTNDGVKAKMLKFES